MYTVSTRSQEADLEKRRTSNHAESNGSRNPNQTIDSVPESVQSGVIKKASEDSILQADVEKVRTGGTNNEYIFIGDKKFLRSELYEAFGGTLNPGLAPAPTHKFANPAPLGLCAFALTTFVLSFYNLNTRGIDAPNVVVGLAAFYGGLIQLLAGMWEVVMENTFGAVALSSYGGFWLSYAAIQIPWFGIKEAYVESGELMDALGLYLLGWALFTYLLTICTMKSTVAFFALFFLLGTTFLLLAIAEFTRSTGVKHAAGALGVIVAFIAWYNAYAGIATKQNSYLVVKPLPLPSSDRHW